MGKEAVDMAGKRVGELAILERAGVIAGKASWKCLCSCGRYIVVRGDHLRAEHTKTCGQCGVVAKQTLNRSNAKYLIHVFMSPEAPKRGHVCLFAVAKDRETGEWATTPPTVRVSALPPISAMHKLVEAGLIGHKDGRTLARWMKEERCIHVETHQHMNVNELNSVQQRLAAELAHIDVERVMGGLMRAQGVARTQDQPVDLTD